jgi:amino acid transporter
LTGSIGPFQYFALGFGSIVGCAWLIVLGEWLKLAGPGGSILVILLGSAVMTLVAACYAELASRIPRVGMEFVYCLKAYGPRLAFLVGWFLTLYTISVTIFEGIALGWLLEVLIPRLRGPAAYSAFGEVITWDALAAGLAGALVIATLNCRGVSPAVRFQALVTYGFLIVAAPLAIWGVSAGSFENARPFWPNTADLSWWNGAGWVLASCAFLFTGFQAIPQMIEERRPGLPVGRIVRVMVVTIAVVALFYCGIILAASMAAPWRTLTGRQLAAAAALDHLPHGHLLATITLAAAVISLLKTWNGFFMIAVRMLLALAREDFIPPSFGRLSTRFRTPARAVLLVGFLNATGISMGNGAISPIINMCSMCLTVGFVLCCIAVLRFRRNKAHSPAAFEVPGGNWLIGAAIGGASLMSLAAFLQPVVATDARFPIEWTLMLIWSALGCAFWLWQRRRPALPR